ncbi:Eukaryotic_translation initiation factor 5 [Hexamita inflata]|uniref:Eukaryotic_translation initiation factor 5 n=1 Tax=Hexamita inflata TaxID=28002 RepID=A0ABP1GWJ0_9EUKA
MPQMINVNFSQDDSYRYKMEAPQIRQEGDGNGVHTAFDNLSQISTALRRSTAELVKHFEFAFGTMCQKKEDAEIYSFNGKYDYQTVMQALQAFVKNYVLCQHCGNPETVHDVKQDLVLSHCRACGKYFELKPKSTQKLIAWLIRIKNTVDQKKRKTINPVQIVGKIQKVIDNIDNLKNQLKEFTDQGQIQEEELPVVLVAAYFQQKDVKTDFPKFLELLTAIDQFTKYHHIYFLYAIELLVKQKLEIFETTPNLLNFILQKSSDLIQKDTFALFRSEQAEIFVPQEFHEKVVDMATQFFDWIDNEDVEEIEEIEEIDEDQE